ncbi:hypothetical protein GcC1_145003 [Golovinomyces cichoracearum]|uniref:Uncharacterized protein n=1 Tax=Golovinomyces cichoracearum TaxID=62708 RepID=A0A420HYY8_9PEZI|nr:hypothetical protein GcC1_145003 [Golovinomyces cichoracearum]
MDFWCSGQERDNVVTQNDARSHISPGDVFGFDEVCWR